MFGTKYEIGQTVYILKQHFFSHKWWVKECAIKYFKIHKEIDENNLGPYISCQICLTHFEKINCLFDTKTRNISKKNHQYREEDLYLNVFFDEEKANKECLKRNRLVDNQIKIK